MTIESDSRHRPIEKARSSTRGCRRSRYRRRILLAAVALVLSVFVVEGISSLLIGSRELWRQRRPTQVGEPSRRHDPDLGWTYIPSKKLADRFPSYGAGITLSINSLGFRGQELVPKGKRYRVVCVGDSFTLGHGVQDDESYPALLERMNPRIQTVNMGHSGYGLGQAALWFERDGVGLDADLVILAFINQGLVRMGMAAHSARGKPRFSTQNGQLHVSNQPVPENSPFSFWGVGASVRHFSTGRVLGKLATIVRSASDGPMLDEESMYQTAALVIARLKQVCDANGAKLVIVHLPHASAALNRITEGRAEGRRIVAFLARQTQSREVPILDLGPVIEALTVPELQAAYSNDSFHMSAKGYAIVARMIDEWAKTVDPDYPG